MPFSRAVLAPAASVVVLAALLLVACNASDPGELIGHTSSAAEVGAWKVAAGPNAPFDRAAPAMAWDPDRNRVVLFGGDAAHGPYAGETWEWDGSKWAVVATSGPPGRIGGRMVYDSTSKRMVLFGGSDSAGGGLNDTWEWDGTTWTQVASTGPSPRDGFGMAYDVQHDRTVLFGGLDTLGWLGDTWEWDGTSWTQVTVSGPSARTGVSMVYDPGRARIVLFGGEDASSTLADTWEWDGSAWTQRSINNGPQARSWTAMAYDSANNVVLMFAGRLSITSFVGGNDLWEYNGVKWTQLCTSGACQSTSPTARYQARIAFDASRSVAVAYGRGPSGGDPKVYEWNGTTWQTRVPVTPGRGTSVATWNPATSRVLMYQPAYGTFEWDGTAWTTNLGATKPTGSPALAFDTGRSRGVLVTTAYSFPLDIWEWNGSDWTQTCTGPPCSNSTPPSRATTTIAYDAAQQRTVLFGGSTELLPATWFDDTWLWNGSTWSNVCTNNNCTRPTKRSGHAMAYDAARSRIVLFGGDAAGTMVGDTWEWNGSSWTQVATTGPSARRDASMTYDSTRQRIILYGGHTNSTAYTDTWEWDGSSWTQMATTGPPNNRIDMVGLAYDPTHKTPVAYGAEGVTWTYHTRGGTCSTTADCLSGTCVDGVCCDSSSCGTCERCNDPANPGVCSPVKNAQDPDTCTGTASCNASGICMHSNGAACSSGAECASGFCADGVCCGTACDASCDVCAAALGAPADGTCGPAPAGAPGDGSCAPFACPGTAVTCATACLSDNVCAPDAYCAPGGVCTPQKTQGAACDPTAGQDCLVSQCRVCASGNCVDGVCCDTACGGQCDVCSQALGASADGTCSPAPAGSAGSPTCFPAMCNGTTASCSTTCTTKQDCANGGYCQGGKCYGSLNLGDPCTNDLACASGYCADGYCCNTACQGSCEECDSVKGTCTIVTGDPHPGHPACPAGSASDPCSKANCDGKNRTSCLNFVGASVTCRAASCTKGTATLVGFCNNLGACQPPDTKPCEPYACGATTCKPSCASDTDCAAGYHCDVPSGKCQNGAICDGDHTITKAGGATQDCSPYHCTTDGTCATSCSSTADCVGGARCDDTGQCKKVNVSSANNPGGCGCRAAAPGQPTEGALALGLLLLFGTRRRRRRKSSSRERVA